MPRREEVKEWNGYTIAELRQELKFRGLSVQGKKKQLVERLEKLEMATEGDDLKQNATGVANKKMADVPDKSFMEKELELLKKEKELLIRENNILLAARQNADISISEVSDLINTFDGEHFSTWKAQINNIQSVYRIAEERMKIIVISKLKGKALQWFHAQPDNIHLGLSALMNELEIIFDTRINKVQRRKHFDMRKWQVSEDFPHYFLEKQILGKQLALSDEELIECTIDGIPNHSLRDQARMQQFQTPQKLLQAFRQISLKGNIQQAVTKHKPQSTSMVQTCYRCGKQGHFATQCRTNTFPPGTCFICGSKQHLKKDCPKLKKDNMVREVNCVRELKINKCINVVKLLLKSEKQMYCWKECKALVDTGSAVNLIKEKLVNKEDVKSMKKETKYFGINSTELLPLGELDSFLDFDNEINKIECVVVANNAIPHDLILGRKFLNSIKARLVIDCIETEKEDDDILSISLNEVKSVEIKMGENLQQKEKIKVYDLIEEYTEKVNQVIESKVDYKMTLKLEKDDYFFCSPRRLAFSEREKLLGILNELMGKGIIRASSSPYCSPIVMVKKKSTDDYRLCVDFRTLNKVTVRENYPLPVIEDVIDKLGKKRFFSSLDLKSGFHQIKMAEDSTKYTSFTTPFGQFEYIKMPFGLKNAPSVFQRFVDLILREVILEGKVAVYMDDILVISESQEEHWKILREVLGILAENKLELNLGKCVFGCEVIDFLGYRISAEGVRPNVSNLKAIEDFPLPKNLRDVQRFLGLCSYFRKFVKDFTILAKPLQDLCKGEKKFVFKDEQFRSFETLKSKLLEAPVLAIFSPDDETQLHCDGSSYGYGAILMQKKKDGKLHPIFYFSKKTTEAESKYHSYELETMAIIYALRRFRVYLLGRPFKIMTDCNALTLTLNKQLVTPRIARWALELQGYDYAIEHREGRRMQHVDALSRCLPVLVLQEGSLEQSLAICQSRDPKLEELRKELEKEDHALFELRDGLIYRKIDKKRVRFYLPEAMIFQILKTCHDDLGHVGVDKSFEVMSRTYWFPKMKEVVREYVKRCPKCIVFNSPSGKQEGYLHPIPKGNIPFDTLHVDHYGPLEPTRHKRKYILVVMDAFTKFVKLFATKSTQTEEAIIRLREYFSMYSRPSRLITDRGSCFTSHSFRKFVEEFNIQHFLVASGCPRANGQVERINRVITPMIAKLVEPGRQWDQVLSDVEFALNNTFSKSSMTTPSTLLFGVNQKGKVRDKIMEYLNDCYEEDSCDIRDVAEIREKALGKMTKSQQYNAECFNKKRKEANMYVVGDLVMLSNVDTTVGVSKKLIPKYKGPYIIHKILDNDRYVLKDVPGFQVTQKSMDGVYDVSRLKPWFYQPEKNNDD